jgi:myo-inositol-1(or 4)-monophosphatase
MTYKKFAMDLAKQAGKVMLANFNFGMKKVIKEDGSPVTKTDLAINKMVVERVKKHFPTHGVLGEEQSNLIANSEYTWVCDPVDGTIPFSRGMPTCAFSLALTRNGEPVLGVAFDPFLNRMFFAEKNKGAFFNGKRVHVSGRRGLRDSFIAYHTWKQAKFQMRNLSDDLIFKHDVCIFPIGSVVYDSMLLAAGELDGAIFPHNTAHDVAAVKIIVEEAGGKVTDLYGNEQRYDSENIKGCAISNGVLHKDLLKVIKKHIKK